MTPTQVTPPVPNASEYPLSALDLFLTATTGPFDPTQRLKNWSDLNALSQGLPTDFITYGAFVQTSPNGLPVFDASAIGMTRQQAATLNIQPGNVPTTDNTSVAMTQPAWPSPARNLVAGETIVPMIGGFNVVNSNYVAPAQPQTTQQSTDSQNIQQILDNQSQIISDLNAIRAKLGA